MLTLQTLVLKLDLYVRLIGVGLPVYCRAKHLTPNWFDTHDADRNYCVVKDDFRWCVKCVHPDLNVGSWALARV